MLFNEALDKFEEYLITIDRSPRTVDLYRRDLIIIKRFLERLYNGPVMIEDITQTALEAFMRYSKEVLKYSPNSRSNLFYTLRSFYAYLYKKEFVNRDIAITMDFGKVPKKERNYLTEEEAQKLVDAIQPPMVKLIAYFLFNTGLRISECLNLKLDDIDLEKKTIHVIEGKGRKDRIVPINEHLYAKLIDYLDNWKEDYGSDYFFATRKEGPISYPHVNSTIRVTARAIGIKKPVSCHVLRHSFASALVKKNVNLVYIQKLLGHESLAVTSIYTHAKLDDLTDAVNTLWE